MNFREREREGRERKGERGREGGGRGRALIPWDVAKTRVNDI